MKRIIISSKATPDIYEALNTLTITHVAPTENLLGTPVDLPTSEPATPQFQYTVLAGDCPTFSFPLASYIKLLALYIAGKNTDTVNAITVSWRMVRWDVATSAWVSIATGSTSITANYYWTLSTAFRTAADGATVGVQVGDLFGIKAWAASAGVNYDYTASFVFWSRPRIVNYNICMAANNVTATYTATLTLGNPSTSNNLGYFWYYYATYRGSTSYLVATDRPYYFSYSTGYVLIARLGDDANVNGGSLTQHATYRPYNYTRVVMPSTWLIRLLKSQWML